MLALFAGAVQSLVETDPMRASVVLAEDMTAGCIVMQENAGRAHSTDIPDKDHDGLTWSLIRVSKVRRGWIGPSLSYRLRGRDGVALEEVKHVDYFS
ncbi:hypothetical protein [Acetobacter fabarum]|uniref:hypothetical protein n=1 Tax=Acetobacter fabarum TaxID=483199 RepID=UPI0039ED5650